MSAYKRTNTLKLFAIMCQHHDIDIHIIDNHVVRFYEFTLFFYLEDRVIIHSRHTQNKLDFSVYSPTQLFIICQYFKLDKKFGSDIVEIDIFKWIYTKPLANNTNISNKKIKSINYVFTKS